MQRPLDKGEFSALGGILRQVCMIDMAKCSCTKMGRRYELSGIKFICEPEESQIEARQRLLSNREIEREV